MAEISYHRAQAIEYATKWAYKRNPRYLDFSEMGGDCTNFISQCIYAGSNNTMNYTPTLGWYYNSAHDRTPSWTGVQYLYRFLTGNKGPGPNAEETDISNVQPGDIIQLGDDKNHFYHSLFIVQTGTPPAMHNILINTHTYDAGFRHLDTYYIEKIRFLHIAGIRK